jgi:hypothetical protein
MNQRKNLIGLLFDFSFNSFITPRIIRLLYIMWMVLTSLACISIVSTPFMISGMLGGTPSIDLRSLIIAPILWIVYVVVGRVVLEVITAVMKTHEDTAQLLELMRDR